MQLSYPILLSIAAVFLVTSCTNTEHSSTQLAANFIQRQDIIMTTKDKYPPKNPSRIAFYQQDKSPHTAYRIIGVATISKYNLLGMQRAQDTINKMMKDLAASVGGDGLMNMSDDEREVKAHVIAFQKILI